MPFIKKQKINSENKKALCVNKKRFLEKRILQILGAVVPISKNINWKRDKRYKNGFLGKSNKEPKENIEEKKDPQSSLPSTPKK